MKLFSRKLLLFFTLSLIIGGGYFLFIDAITTPIKPSPPAEKIEESLSRIYENFLHKTKYSYETILESGTDYSKQEKIFLELTKKMKDLDPTQTADYEVLRIRMLEEIKKNEEAFKTFYIKIAKISPEALKKQIEERSQQYDIILESE